MTERGDLEAHGSQFVLPFSNITFDRASEHRVDASWLSDRFSSEAARMLELWNNKVPVTEQDDLVWSKIESATTLSESIFLGLDAHGSALFAVDRGEVEPEDVRLEHLRDVGAGLSSVDAAGALAAVALTSWHRRHRFCATCGAPTDVVEGGHTRNCPRCGASHYPRMDPAVIMLVSDGERCVLGQRPGATAGRWSTLAGYVEPGETLEGAVIREVREEVGIPVTSVTYRGSQPWPFPSSLMLAFTATAEFAPLVLNVEHQDVRWFTRDEIAAGLANQTLSIPPPTSAGHHLITGFVAGTF